MDNNRFFLNIREQAKKLKKTILLPDATDIRTLKAAKIISEDNIALPILIGTEELIYSVAKKENVSIKNIRIVDPKQSELLKNFSEGYYEMRKSRGVSNDKSTATMSNPLFFAAMMVREKFADGCVAGSLSTTADVLRAGLHIIGMKEGIDIISSFFLMVFPNKVFCFADCAVVPEPTVEQLADIAIITAENYERLFNEKAFVAMLSFSTKGSASHPSVEKVHYATELAKKKNPNLHIDGELQFDTAIIPEIAYRKAPQSMVAGKANVLIFPDLNSGNIGYKIAQHLGGAKAIGPIVQGFKNPFFDLSRGCSVDDIVNVVAINAVL